VKDGRFPVTPSTEPTRAVYTALFGRYERLQEQPVRERSGVAFVCFTDDPELVSSTWDIRLVEPALPLDTARSVRYPKILGVPLADEFDETLWIDNRVILREPPELILDELLRDADLGVMKHSFRSTVLAEFDAVVRADLDDPSRVFEQLLHYAETAPESLDLQPYWGGLIARRWTAEVRAAMRSWLDHVLRYSRRDQLSFRLATEPLGSVRAVEFDNLASPWHDWLTEGVDLARDSSMREGAYRRSIRAPLARLAGLTAELEDARRQTVEFQQALAAAEVRVAELTQRLELHENSRAVQLSARVRRVLRRMRPSR